MRSRSRGLATPKDDAMKCQVCNNGIETNKGELKDSTLCFSCNYWQTRVDRLGHSQQLIVDGVVYQAFPDKPNDPHKKWLGFSGRRFTWRWLDGRDEDMHTTNDMWFNGDPPHPHFKALLQDNAEWM